MPPLARIWFDGQYASAFDDNIGIRVPCDLPINGGLDGVYLAGSVDRSKVKNVEVSTKGAVALLKLGSRINLKLDIMGPECAQFVLPEPEPKAFVQIGDRKALISVLKFCLQSVGHDVTRPEFYGVTFVADGKGMLVYAGYSQVLVEGRVALEQKPKFKRVTVPAKFCEQLVALIDNESTQLELHDDHAMLVSPNITVFARSLNGKTEIRLGDMVAAAVSKAKTFVTVPPLDNMLARAALFPGDHLNMRLSVAKTGKHHVLKMYSEGGGIELIDMSEPIDPHDEIEVSTNARHLRSGAMLEELSIGNDAIIFRDQDIIQVVSVKA